MKSKTIFLHNVPCELAFSYASSFSGVPHNGCTFYDHDGKFTCGWIPAVI